MYRTKKDKKIQTQERMIQRLEEENECLREQLELCDPEHIKNRLLLAQQSHEDYTKLVMELNELRGEYRRLLQDMKQDKEELIRRSG